MITNPAIVHIIYTTIVIDLYIKRLRTKPLTSTFKQTVELRMRICTHSQSRHCPEKHHTAITTHDFHCTMFLDYYKQQFNWYNVSTQSLSKIYFYVIT